ncbi:hypothetical protein KMW28_27250 [Flammeovirga yaeyamensis]|uniref:Uncharacterized protein n=1 Tax=Flammeovirga yaeyamensis TaxID=367791 RepID=A0AAX1NF19_9BACT|nr:hypothetical protein [Flammeovirga yaeyamensis]MBB3700021.1 hypothetical protein [Flammeovirga yaeyamensis]NMF37541.1 hypothetical protein [Flammeovirga yaeyamensis]QWG04598.1 hypothetical protein KMW28_27250 [Flammeovirga yaeyamensis]
MKHLSNDLLVSVIKASINLPRSRDGVPLISNESLIDLARRFDFDFIRVEDYLRVTYQY